MVHTVADLNRESQNLFHIRVEAPRRDSGQQVAPADVLQKYKRFSFNLLDKIRPHDVFMWRKIDPQSGFAFEFACNADVSREQLVLECLGGKHKLLLQIAYDVDIGHAALKAL